MSEMCIRKKLDPKSRFVLGLWNYFGINGFLELSFFCAFFLNIPSDLKSGKL
jgi:hypothetical protein